VSFSIEHKKLPAGQYKIRFFDEELYGSLRKVGTAMDAVFFHCIYLLLHIF